MMVDQTSCDEGKQKHAKLHARENEHRTQETKARKLRIEGHDVERRTSKAGKKSWRGYRKKYLPNNEKFSMFSISHTLKHSSGIHRIDEQNLAILNIRLFLVKVCYYTSVVKNDDLLSLLVLGQFLLGLELSPPTLLLPHTTNPN
jgi:hypothetical protein